MSELVPAEEQVRAEELVRRLDEFGISRLADTTGLDRIGIPTQSCVRPGTADAIWVYSGKGHTVEHAQISAVMECVERTSALWDPTALVEWSVDSEHWSPQRFTERRAEECPLSEVAWVRARSLSDGAHILLPAEIVFNGSPGGTHRQAFVVSSSNGLGAGFSLEQATYRALSELIERDAISCAELRTSHAGVCVLLTLSEALGLNHRPLADYRDDVDACPTIDPGSLPEQASRLYCRFAECAIDATIKAVPNDFGIPVFAVAAMEPLSFDVVLAASGYGADCDPAVALCAALLELAQSRGTDRQGAREDCVVPEKARLHAVPASHWLATPGHKRVPFNSIEWRNAGERTIQNCIRGLTTAGFSDVAVFEFKTHPGISVVRAIVPGIETWHATAGNSTLGWRMQKEFFP